YPSAQWVQNADRLIQVEGRLPAILTGEIRPANSDEELALAVLCQRYKRLYATAAHFYAGAFAGNPKLAEDRRAGHCYNAACAAALAAAGQGEDAPHPPDKVRLSLRRQALAWLRDDLAAYTKLAAPDDAKAKDFVRQNLAHRQQDGDLASV